MAGLRAIGGALPPPVRRTAQSVVGAATRRRHAGPLRDYLRRVEVAVGGFAGRRLVEIGGDHSSQALRLLAAESGAAELIGLNPAFPAARIAANARTLQVPAESSGLADESVDAAWSTSAFEHIGGLPAVLAEMHRVLRPGGRLFSHFGPIWSTAYGHHLWIEHGGRTLTYHSVLVPPWAHLLETREGLTAQLVRDHGAAAGRAMATFIYDSPDQNRLFYDDYLRIFAESPLTVRYVKGYDAPGLADKYPGAADPDLLDAVRTRFPGREGFLFDGITVLLEKPAT